MTEVCEVPRLVPPGGEPHVPAAGGGFSRMVSARRAQGTARDERLLETCRDLEAMLWQQVVGSMRKAYQGEGGLFENGTDSEIWQGMLDEQWAQALTRRTTSLAAALARQLAGRTRDQSPTSQPSPPGADKKVP